MGSDFAVNKYLHAVASCWILLIYNFNLCCYETLREERTLRVFENRVSRKIFGPKIEEVTMEWKKLQNVELNDLYSSPNIFRVIKLYAWDI